VRWQKGIRDCGRGRSVGYTVPPVDIYMYRIKKEKVQSTSSENRRADGARDEDTKIYHRRAERVVGE